MKSRPTGEVRLDEQERALVATWRAFRAYVLERARLDPTLDDPKPDDDLELRLGIDGAGFVHVDPEDPNLDEFDAVEFYDLQTAAAKIDAKRKIIELARIERDTFAGRSFGDPRKGRKAPKTPAKAAAERAKLILERRPDLASTRLGELADPKRKAP